MSRVVQSGGKSKSVRDSSSLKTLRKRFLSGAHRKSTLRIGAALWTLLEGGPATVNVSGLARKLSYSRPTIYRALRFYARFCKIQRDTDYPAYGGRPARYRLGPHFESSPQRVTSKEKRLLNSNKDSTFTRTKSPLTSNFLMEKKSFDTFGDQKPSQEPSAVFRTAGYQKKPPSKALHWGMYQIRKAASGLKEDQISGIGVALNRALRKGEIRPGKDLKDFTARACLELEGRHSDAVSYTGSAWRHVYLQQVEEPIDLDRRGCYAWGRSFVVGVLSAVEGYDFAMKAYGAPPVDIRKRRIQAGMDSLYRVLEWLDARCEGAEAKAEDHGWDDWGEKFKERNWEEQRRICAKIEKLRTAREELDDPRGSGQLGPQKVTGVLRTKRTRKLKKEGDDHE